MSECPRLGPEDGGRHEAQVLLAEAGISTSDRFVLAAVGGRPGSAKAAPPETWEAVFQSFRAKSDAPVLLTCGPGEEVRMEALVKGGLPKGVSVTRGGPTGLQALLGLMELAAAFVTADSGPRHLAAAIGCPSVVLHGSTDPRHSGVTGARIRSSRLHASCAPCHLERCPLKGTLRLACFGLSHAEPVAAMLCELLETEAEEMKP